MTEDQDVKDGQIEVGSKTYTNKTRDKKSRVQRPLTKIILRRLPPTMTEETFLEQVSPIPEHDLFYFAKPDPSLANNSYSRAYINFINVEDIYLFRDKFDGYVFVDDKGVEYVGIVEYAPFQRIPKKKKKKDPKCGTIESDPVYQEFIESLTEQDTESQPKLEYSYPVNDVTDKKVVTTPLLEYLAARKQDKRNRDERRRRENDKRKMRILKSKEGPIKEEDIPDADVKKVKSRDWEKDKVKTKDDQSKSVDGKDVVGLETKTFREQRKVGVVNAIDKKKKYDIDRKETDENTHEEDKQVRKDKREKESPREQKSKKYSDTRKERFKNNDIIKIDKSINKIITSASHGVEKSSDVKLPRSINHDDIKPFTQLPQVKTDDLTKMLEERDKKNRADEKLNDLKTIKDAFDNKNDKIKKSEDIRVVSSRIRRNSLESGEKSPMDDSPLKRQNSLDDSSKSSREESLEKDKNESAERRSEKRIRNKDRPSLVIYQPGMGKFSKQRMAKEKETHQSSNSKNVNDSEKKDT